MSTPLVALTMDSAMAQWGIWPQQRAAVLPWTYIDRVTEAGGHPVLLPPLPRAATALMNTVDGLVLTGGPDIGPACYGAEPGEFTFPPDPARDALELSLLDIAQRRGIPVLGICRGMQMLSIARSGTLRQHLPEHAPKSPGRFDANYVRISGDSLLGQTLGTSFVLRCHHHQGIDRLGTGLVPTAWADDGGIEGLEAPEEPFMVGVQAHLEESADTGALFSAFVKAASNVSGQSVPGDR